TAARLDSLRAEFVSRSADDRERVVAMGEAARCLALLEHDLPQAETLVLEARAIARRVGVETSAVPAAQGMLCLHRGEFDEAAELLHQSRIIARRDGNRIGEFYALEYAVLLELYRDDLTAADVLAAELRRLGERLREGSEAPFAAALATA